MKVYLKSNRFALGLAALSLAAIGDASAQLQDGAFQFSLIGDMPYTTVQQQEYQRVLAALNKTAFMSAISKMTQEVTIPIQPSVCCRASTRITRQYTSRSRASGIRSS